MAEKPDQLFETMLKEAGVPTTEAAMKAEWDAINAAEGSQITNNSAWSPFPRRPVAPHPELLLKGELRGLAPERHLCSVVPAIHDATAVNPFQQLALVALVLARRKRGSVEILLLPDPAAGQRKSLPPHPAG